MTLDGRICGAIIQLDAIIQSLEEANRHRPWPEAESLVTARHQLQIAWALLVANFPNEARAMLGEMTKEEVDMALREEGLDPGEVEKRGREFMAKGLAALKTKATPVKRH